MARIKINDLPKDMKISKNDMRKITGGALYKSGYTDSDGSPQTVVTGNADPALISKLSGTGITTVDDISGSGIKPSIIVGTATIAYTEPNVPNI